MKKLIFISLLILVILFGGYKLYDYYQSTYVGIETYAQVPSEIPVLSELKDINGALITEDGVQQYEYKYELIGVTIKGEKRPITFSVSGESPTPLKPGSYIKIESSEKRVMSGPVEVKEESIPQSIVKQVIQ